MIETAKSNLVDWARLIRQDRDGSLYGSLWIVAACLGVLALLPLSGCSGSSHAGAVNAPLARESLKIALDHWKNGEDPKSLQSSATPMTAQDFEWSAGAKLLDYQILDEGKEEDANLRVQVKITLGPQGKSKSVEKKAWYVVGTSPSVTVFRDIMQALSRTRAGWWKRLGNQDLARARPGGALGQRSQSHE